MVKAYYCDLADGDFCAIVVAKTRGRAKAMCFKEYNAWSDGLYMEYTDVRIRKIADDVDGPERFVEEGDLLYHLWSLFEEVESA